MKVILFAMLAMLVSTSVEARDYRDDYKSILDTKCSVLIKGETDERAIAWGCPLERTKKLKALQLELEAALVKFFKERNDSEAVEKFKRLSALWDGYSKESKYFNYAFHLNGSMGTSGRIKSEQFLVKKRIEILLDYMYGYYELEL